MFEVERLKIKTHLHLPPKVITMANKS